MNRRTRLATLSLVVGTLALPTLPGSALAKGGDDVVRRGGCSKSATWKVKVSPDDGRLEVEGEVDTNVVGQTWRWRLRHNGSITARGTRTTTSPSGSFEVRRVLVNLRGKDELVFRARNPRSGQVCRGTVTF